MMRGATILWAALATVAGTGLFMLKYEVQTQEHRLTGLHREIAETDQAIHVLKAEWSYLNDPIRLRDQAERHLGLHPIKPGQIMTVDSLPMADPRPPAIAADEPAPAAPSPPQSPPPPQHVARQAPPSPQPQHVARQTPPSPPPQHVARQATPPQPQHVARQTPPQHAARQAPPPAAIPATFPGGGGGWLKPIPMKMAAAPVAKSGKAPPP